MEPDSKLYFGIRDALDVVAKIYNRMEATGVENVPDGGAVVCPYHQNYADPFYVGAALKDRMLHFLAWHGILEMPLIGQLVERIGTVHPITESYGVAEDKDEAKQVMGELRELLEQGELVCIFPSGSIKHWIRPNVPEPPFKPGALRLAAQVGVPVIPVGLYGTRWVVPNIINLHDWGGPDKGLWVPGALPVKVRVAFGEPFEVDPEAATDRAAAESEAARLQDVVMELNEGLKPGSILKDLF